MKASKKERRGLARPLAVAEVRDLVGAWAPLVGANDSPTVLGVLIASTLRGGIQ